MPRGVPQRSKQGFHDAMTTITEVEYIGELATLGANFNVNWTLPINPGSSTTFPWLSKVAAQYEKYVFRSLVFFYKPEVSQYVANANTGKVMFACDYDAADPAPNNKQAIEDMWPHADGMPYETLTLELDPKQLHQNSDAKFIRTGVVPGGTDVKTYDAGNVFFATSGQGAGMTLGELRVSYVVDLFIPAVQVGIPASLNNSVLFNLTNLGQALTGSNTWTQLTSYWYNPPQLDPWATSGWNTGNILIPPGNYAFDAVFYYVNANNTIIQCQSQVQTNGTPPLTVPNVDAVSTPSINIANQVTQGYIQRTQPWTLTLWGFAGWTTGLCNVQAQVRLIAF